jgi:hypothetical protein
MNPDFDSDFSLIDWKDIFSQNLIRLDLIFNENYDDHEDFLGLRHNHKHVGLQSKKRSKMFRQNVKTFLQETHLKHLVIEAHYHGENVTKILDLIPEIPVTKFELLTNAG